MSWGGQTQAILSTPASKLDRWPSPPPSRLLRLSIPRAPLHPPSPHPHPRPPGLPGFQFFSLQDSPDYDLERAQGSVEELAARCAANTYCRGFVSWGFLKHTIKLPANRPNVRVLGAGLVWAVAARAVPCPAGLSFREASASAVWVPAGALRAHPPAVHDPSAHPADHLDHQCLRGPLGQRWQGSRPRW
jgi:hypothetical protein